MRKSESFTLMEIIMHEFALLIGDFFSRFERKKKDKITIIRHESNELV